MIISHTVEAVGSALVSVSVTIGFALVVVPAVMVHSNVSGTVADPLAAHLLLRESSAFVQAAP
jgi:hypothetical protein